MKKLTFDEIIAKCKELDFSKSDYGYGKFDKNIFGEVKQVYSQGGEGKGENWERVYHFIDHNVYLSMCGYYQSYNGVEFYDYEPTEVKPKQKIITVYE